MQNHNAKLKAIFILAISFLVLSGCAKNNSLTKKDNIVPEKTETIWTSDVQNKKQVKILFVGDMMFDRYIREAVGKYGGGDYNHILEPVRDKLAEYDLIVGNLEGPITDKESVSVGTAMEEKNNFRFTFDPAVAKTLSENNIKLVNLGNNHILNQEEGGVAETKKYLDEARVEYFGDLGKMEIESPRGDSTSKVVNINGIKISFVSYNYSVPDSVEAAIENIQSAKKQSNIVIVCPHWGTEYKVGDPGEAVRALAHRFVDAGAETVIGTHPHVVEDSEVYNGKKIYYSLGNFVFDQYFQPETMEGLGVELDISSDRSLQYNELNFVMNKRGQTELKAEN